jgi:hypothetical protein
MDGSGDIDPHTLPLSPSLIERLTRWAEVYTSVLNMDDPKSSYWPSEEAYNAFYCEAYQLWLALREELADHYEVLYQDGGEVFDNPKAYAQQYPEWAQ